MSDAEASFLLIFIDSLDEIPTSQPPPNLISPGGKIGVLNTAFQISVFIVQGSGVNLFTPEEVKVNGTWKVRLSYDPAILGGKEYFAQVDFVESFTGRSSFTTCSGT